SNVFGLEPNYPCCTVNHPQGWPKFVSNAFLTTPDQKSLVHLYLGPFSTTATLASGNKVTVNVDTLYPFSDTLTTTITATSAFTYFVRIPSWVVGGTIAINGAAARAVSPSNGLLAVQVTAGTTKFVLNLPAQITTGSRLRSIYQPPILRSIDNRESRAVDLEFDATAPWQYAIDPATLKFSNKAPASGRLPSPIFDAGQPPFTITATACRINWSTGGDTFAAPPPTNTTCTGAQTTITLWPFGVSFEHDHRAGIALT
ncbi:hypothetical protein PLEOSDRAFT_1033818, partial [Pleurotus ostreatus PC15]